jgi:ABC-2 type transport system permease protein
MNWWPHVVSLEFRKILVFRTEFWVTFLGQTLVQLVIARSLWGAIFEQQNVTEMNGFTLPMLTLYYVIVPIGSRILTGENIGFLSREIYEGTFTRYLLYPLSWFQYKTLTYFSYSLFYALQLTIFFLGYKLFLSGGMTVPEFGNLLLGIGLFLLSSLMYLMMSMAVELLALWADNIWSLMVMLRFFSNFLGGALIPLAFFPKRAQEILVYTPFPNLVSLPARTIMGLATSHEIFKGLLVIGFWAVVLAIVVNLLWKRGQKKYSGVGI